MRSLITSIRDVPAGDFVGYNATLIAKQPMRVATVPVGYFEGVDRRLSNVGSFLVNSKACGLAGRVSMNMSSIDVTVLSGVQRGDVVTVISRNRGDQNSVENIARLSDTTPYVVLVHISQHLKRVVE
jgi:alanine racemase